MRVLVTGGTGFLGSFVVRALARRGHDIRVFDARPDPANLDFAQPGLSARVELVTGDITDRDAVLKAASGCGYAVHLAGIMTVDCRRDPPRAASINLLGSLHVFEAALAHTLAGVAYVSTAGVYGVEDGQHPLPMTHYGALKLAVEGCARAYFTDHGLPSTGFRPYIIYGPGASSGISSGPSVAIRAAHRGEAAEILFTGGVGLVHVEDVAEAFAATVDASPQTVEVHNLVGETATIVDFINALKQAAPAARITASGPPLLIAPELEIAPRPAWLAALPVTGMHEGIARTLAHYAQIEQTTEVRNADGRER